MFVPLWLIGLTVALILFLAARAFRGGGGGEMIERQQRAAPPPLSSPERSAALADPEIRMALAGRNKLEAIKLVRDRTGLGLKEAKELIERELQ
jgi:large subunit ribosomal protein L7/L12